MQRTIIRREVGIRFLQIHPDLFMADLRIVDGDKCIFRDKVFHKRDSSRLPCVARVGFECESQDCDALYPT